MHKSCECSTRPNCIICQFPPCKCMQCKLLRCEGKPDREGKKLLNIEDCEEFDTKNLLSKEGQDDSRQRKSSTDADDVIFDVVGITAFLLMATVVFWLTVCSNLWRYTVFTIESGRKVQLIALVMLLIILGCITYHGIRGRNRKLQALQSPLNDTHHLTAQNSTIHKCPQKCCRCKKCCAKNFKGSCDSLLSSSSYRKSNTNLEKSPTFSDDNTYKETPSLCSLCSKLSSNSFHSSSSSVHTMSDDEIRKMYAKFKLYFMPTEMKTPPSPKNFIAFLTNLFNRIWGILMNTPT